MIFHLGIFLGNWQKMGGRDNEKSGYEFLRVFWGYFDKLKGKVCLERENERYWLKRVILKVF